MKSVGVEYVRLTIKNDLCTVTHGFCLEWFMYSTHETCREWFMYGYPWNLSGMIYVRLPMKAAGMEVRKSFWLLTGTPVSASCISLKIFSSCNMAEVILMVVVMLIIVIILIIVVTARFTHMIL